MSVILNGSIQCSAAEVRIPRGGAPWATVEHTAGDTPMLAEGARVMLDVAGLRIACAVLPGGAGERGGVRTYELVGGAGGWARDVPAGSDGGHRNDAGVMLSTVARRLAESVGETLATVPAGADRALGTHAMRGGEQNAGAMLSLLCGLPGRAPRVPWHVGLDGVTRLGSRATLPAVTATEIDRDPLGDWVAFAEDDASSLLPGATVGGREVLSLEIRASASGVRETVYLAPTDGGAGTDLMSELRAWVLALLRPLVFPRGLYLYRISPNGVSVDGRFDAVPERSLFAKPLQGLRFWPGAAGHAARPKIGSRIIVAFLDGDPNQPIVLGTQPLDAGLGKPNRIDHDAALVVLAQGTYPAARGGATLGLGLVPGPLVLTVTEADGTAHTWSVAAAAGATPVVFTVTPGVGVAIDGTAPIESGRPEVLV